VYVCGRVCVPDRLCYAYVVTLYICASVPPCTCASACARARVCTCVCVCVCVHARRWVRVDLILFALRFTYFNGRMGINEKMH
jgi:hypothetical protein